MEEDMSRKEWLASEELLSSDGNLLKITKLVKIAIC